MASEKSRQRRVRAAEGRPARGGQPDPAPPEPDRSALVDRLNEVSGLARTSWFTLLAFLLFVGITLLGVEDADFFLPSRQTDLPLVGVQIPTASFFWTAPVLGAALYTYLHLFLIKLWELHAALCTTAEDAANNWLVNDLALILMGDATARARPLAWLTSLVTRLLVWASAPIVLGYAWWRSMPAHDEWMTLLIAACLAVTLLAGFTSWWAAVAQLRGGPGPWRGWWHRQAAVATALLLVVVSWLRTEGGLDHYIDRPWAPTLRDVSVTLDSETPLIGRWLAEPLVLPLARTDLSGGALGAPPPDWRDYDNARRAFRENWCKSREIDLVSCDLIRRPWMIDTPEHTVGVAGWCTARGTAPADCPAAFSQMETAFEAAWTEDRRATLSNLDTPDLSRADLRGANLAGAFLVSADLRWARLQRATLLGAWMEGADLTWAALDDADLRWARMESAHLMEVRAPRANLRGARLENADLTRIDLDGASLPRARLEGADLNEARVERANLYESRLTGAALQFVSFKESDLREAVLDGAYLDHVWTERAAFNFVSLEQAIIRNLHLTPSTAFYIASLRGALISDSDLTPAFTFGFTDRVEPSREDCAFLADRLSGAFGDASVSVRCGLAAGRPPLAHWPAQALEPAELQARWRRWQRSLLATPPPE